METAVYLACAVDNRISHTVRIIGIDTGDCDVLANDIVAKTRQNIPEDTDIEIEVTSTKEALEALKAGADIIMLDNMTPNEMRQVVNLVEGQAKIEASGGVILENVHQIAMTGVDYISVGALTHSYRALDISLKMEPQTLKLL